MAGSSMVCMSAMLFMLVTSASFSEVAAHNGRHHNDYNPYTSRRLRYNADGTFKILQVADMHYTNGAVVTGNGYANACQNILPEWAAAGPCDDTNTTQYLAQLLDLERPDLVVFTGDNIFGSDCINHNDSMREFRKPLEDREIPWMIIFGNHDEEYSPNGNAAEGLPPTFTTRRQLVAVDQESKLSLTQVRGTRTYMHSLVLWSACYNRKYGPSFLHGVGTYAYTVNGHSDNKPKHALYLFDSGAYNNSGPSVFGGDGGYDWVHYDQVAWYATTSKRLTKREGRQIPAVAFWHIPIPEYETAYSCGTGSVERPDRVDYRGGRYGTSFGPLTTEAGTGLFATLSCEEQLGKIKGDKHEGVYSPHVSTGLLGAFNEIGDVKMGTVGHDHINDFCAPFLGVHLCYGGGFGYHAYGIEGLQRRARIKLYESGRINTYKRLDYFGNYDVIDYQTIYEA
eukprot:jgi/Chlat1/421/Chrsp10S01471